MAASDAGPVEDAWRVVVLFDLELSEPLLLRNGAVMLAERAAELTALGPVEVVLAGDGVRTSLPPTTSAPVLDEALAWIRVRESSRHLQAERRREFAERERPTLAAAEAAAAGEREALAAHLDRLLDWAATEAGDGPQLLLYVGGGYEADPAAFYAEALRAADDGGAEMSPCRRCPRRTSSAALCRCSAGRWWPSSRRRAATPWSRAPTSRTPSGSSAASKRTAGWARWRSASIREAAPRRREGREISVLADPVAPLAELAEQTGGELLVDPLRMADLAERLRGRHRLRLELDPPPAEPTPVRVAAGGEEVRARRWIGSRLPLAVSAARVRQLLRDELDEGDFWVEAVVEPVSSRGRARGEREPTGAAGAARLTLQLEPEASAGELRLTLASPGARPACASSTSRSIPRAAVDGLIRMDLPAALAGDGEEALAVLVEELAGGRRGGRLRQPARRGVVARGRRAGLRVPGEPHAAPAAARLRDGHGADHCSARWWTNAR